MGKGFEVGFADDLPHDGGVLRAWRDRVHGDPGRCQFSGKDFRQRHHCALGRRVVSTGRCATVLPGQGGHVHDTAVAVTGHVATEDLAGTERALESDGHHRVQLLGGDVHQRPCLGRCCIVDQNLHRSEVADDPGQQALERRLVADVDLVAAGRVSGAEFGCQRVCGIPIDICDGDSVAGGVKLADDERAEPAPATGDDGNRGVHRKNPAAGTASSLSTSRITLRAIRSALPSTPNRIRYSTSPAHRSCLPRLNATTICDARR